MTNLWLRLDQVFLVKVLSAGRMGIGRMRHIHCLIDVWIANELPPLPYRHQTPPPKLPPPKINSTPDYPRASHGSIYHPPATHTHTPNTPSPTWTTTAKTSVQNKVGYWMYCALARKNFDTFAIKFYSIHGVFSALQFTQFSSFTVTFWPCFRSTFWRNFVLLFSGSPFLQVYSQNIGHFPFYSFWKCLYTALRFTYKPPSK